MPDLSAMPVKVGIHESVIDRIKPGLPARVTLPDKTLDGEVSFVSPVTRPAGWWTGNVVKYDTIVELPSVEGLKPGMTAEVEVVIARHENVLTIPVGAVVETADGDFCWVETAEGAKRRRLTLGDTNDEFIAVQAGVEEGDQVVLNPLATIEEAQSLALRPRDETKPPRSKSLESGARPGRTPSSTGPPTRPERSSRRMDLLTRPSATQEPRAGATQNSRTGSAQESHPAKR